MIHTLAWASFLQSRPDWLEAAERAARRLLEKCTDDGFHLHRILLNGAVSIDGRLEDYTNLAQGLITLFDVTANHRYLQAAASLTRQALQEFYDEPSQTLYLGPRNQSGPQLTRPSSATDGATLSPTATMLDNLLQLSRRAALLTQPQPPTWLTTFDAIAARLHSATDTNPISCISLHRLLAARRRPVPQPIQYAAAGLCRITLSNRQSIDDQSFTFTLRLELQPGWHLTAPLDLHPAEAERHWTLEKTVLPPPTHKLRTPAGNLPIYEGTVEFTCTARRTQTAADALSHALNLQIHLQLCNESTCQPPETLPLRI